MKVYKWPVGINEIFKTRFTLKYYANVQPVVVSEKEVVKLIKLFLKWELGGQQTFH